jgi:hypothetical protein
MRTSLLLIFAFLVSLSTAYAAPYAVAPKVEKEVINKRQTLKDHLKGMSLEEVINLTPKQYREQTGKRLGLVQSAKLKIAQSVLKKQTRATDLPKGAYIVLAIIGFGWLAMGLLDDFEGNNWWIALLLYFLFFIPGVIFALIKMGDYY